MPTPEEIKKIAIEYAESKCSVQEYLRAYDKRDNLNGAYSKEALAVLEFLSKDYCIVPKSKARELQQIVIDNADSLDHGLIDGLSDWVEINLGSQLFEEEKL